MFAYFFDGHLNGLYNHNGVHYVVAEHPVKKQ